MSCMYFIRDRRTLLLKQFGQYCHPCRYHLPFLILLLLLFLLPLIIIIFVIIIVVIIIIITRY